MAPPSPSSTPLIGLLCRSPGLRRLALAVALGLALPASAQLPPDLQGPPPVCRAGYLEFEAAHGLEGVRAAVQQALARDDQLALGFLVERLEELIGKDAPTALQVVAWAEASAMPEPALYLRALRGSDAVQEPTVSSRLLSLAETRPDPERQVLALVALETQHRLTPELLERLTALAKRDGLAPGVAMQAVRTLGRVMESDFQRTGRLEPALHKLLEVARGSTDPRVRSLAVEMGGYPDARLDDASVAGLAELMKKDPDRRVREMAALVLSSGRDTQAVLEHFREAFPAEKDRCVRWALVRYAVRAGGAQALPLLRDFGRADPRFRQDAADFQALYDAGYVDFNHVWMNKKLRHASCEGSEE